MWKGKHNSHVSAIISLTASSEISHVALRRQSLKMDGFWRLNIKISDTLPFFQLGERERSVF